MVDFVFVAAVCAIEIRLIGVLEISVPTSPDLQVSTFSAYLASGGGS